MKELWEAVGRALDIRLFSIGNTVVTIATLATSLVVLTITVWLARTIRRLIRKTMTHRGARPDVIGTTSGLAYYSVMIAGFAVALNTSGIELGTLFAAGAIFAVGLGFAMQSIAQNFVAGIILLTERTIKPGDMLEVEGTLVRIVEMGIRSCIAQSRDGEDLIIPNSILIQTTVKNFTLREPTYRVRIPVGVAYDSDMALVRDTLAAAAREAGQKWSSPKDPIVLLTGFGDNSVNWDVGIWINDPWERRVAMSDLLFAVWWAFQNKGIVIAFPQLDVHFDPGVAPLRAAAS